MVKTTTLALAQPPATGAELFTAEDMESDDSMWALYDRWAARYGVARHPGEKLRRFAIFKDTARRVYAGDKHYVLGLNVFADMDTTDEFRARHSCDMPVDGGQRHVNTAGGARAGRAGHTLQVPDAKGPSGQQVRVLYS